MSTLHQAQKGLHVTWLHTVYLMWKIFFELRNLRIKQNGALK